MIPKKLTPLSETIARLRWLLFIIGSFYLGSLAGGVLVGRFAPPAVQSLFAVDESQRIESLEKIFGRFRAPVREGRVTTIVACSGLVFGINLLGFCAEHALERVSRTGLFQLGAWGMASGGESGAAPGDLLLLAALLLAHGRFGVVYLRPLRTTVSRGALL